MPSTPDVQRYAAFADRPDRGNPAGVVLDARQLTTPEMQGIATEVGYSETAFVTSELRPGPLTVRYFAPEGEVDFCGHATVATTVALGHELGFGRFALNTNVGIVDTSSTYVGGRAVGAFRSPALSCTPITSKLLDELLRSLGWACADLHPDYPPAIGFGGNLHPVLVVRTSARLADLEYDFAKLRELCLTEKWVTLQLITPTNTGHWRSRNPFPWGGVVEDPATGAAAAAFAGYLKTLGRINPGDRFTITQGVEMGRQSRIDVELLDTTAQISGPVTTINPMSR